VRTDGTLVEVLWVDRSISDLSTVTTWAVDRWDQLVRCSCDADGSDDLVLGRNIVGVRRLSSRPWRAWGVDVDPLSVSAQHRVPSDHPDRTPVAICESPNVAPRRWRCWCWASVSHGAARCSTSRDR
jgi:hypothetical protein